MFFKTSQNSQKTTCVRASFNKVAGLRPATLLKRRLWHRFFPVNLQDFFAALFLQNTYDCFCAFIYFKKKKRDKKSRTLRLFIELQTVTGFDQTDQSYEQRNHRKCSVKKGVLKNFVNLTGKHLCWSLFLKTHILKNICERLLLHLENNFNACK